MPYRPDAKAAESARYGLASADPMRTSTRCDLSLPGMRRNAVVRFSMPQVASSGAQYPGTSRE
ncbi:hypothetical protein D3C78_1264150 [compost metagenome]